MKNKDLKAVLIDFDGTLLDSLPALYKTYFEFLQMEGFEGTSEEFRLLNGIQLEDVVVYLHNKYKLKDPIHRLNEQYRMRLSKNYHTELKLFPGVKEFLNYAKKRRLKLVVVSSGSGDFIEALLKAEEAYNFFNAIITPQGKFRSKPAPDLYLEALSLLDLKAHEALAIEDAPMGVQAAAAAHIPVLQMSHGKKSPPPKARRSSTTGPRY